jgi:hypothetical protein
MYGIKLATEFRPGDVCRQNGLYEVVHSGHRPRHRVIVCRDDSFPPCKQCGASVRFRLITACSSEPVQRHFKAAPNRGRG